MFRYLSLFRGSALVILCVGMTGCASIFSGGSEKVAFTSTPPGAKVEVLDTNNKTVGTGVTPCNIELVRGAGYFRSAQYTIQVAADGYPTKELPLIAGINGWYWGNIAIGGGLGMLIIDPLTGAMFSFPDTQIDMAAVSSNNHGK